VARKLPHEAWVQVQRSKFHLVTASVNGRERRGARFRSVRLTVQGRAGTVRETAG